MEEEKKEKKEKKYYQKKQKQKKKTTLGFKIIFKSWKSFYFFFSLLK